MEYFVVISAGFATGIAVGLIAVLPVMWKNFSSKRAGQNEATKAAARKAV